MRVDVTIKNYRCFPDSSPAHIALRDGFTAFVGANNSGKSTLLRFFYEFRGLFLTIANPRHMVEAMRGGVPFDPTLTGGDYAELFCNVNHLDLQVEFEFHDEIPRLDKGIAVPILQRLLISVSRDQRLFRVELYTKVGHRILESDQPTAYQDGYLVVAGTPMLQIRHVYDLLKCLAEMLYIGAFRNAINVGGNHQYYDIQTGSDFVERWRQYKTGTSKQHNQAALRLTHDICRIFGFESLEINSSQDGTTLQVFLNGKSYRLEELGSGLAQFLMVLTEVATRQPSYVLIDEPEANLHPQLQIDFLTSLGYYARNGVLFATHNIGLARACADRIYTIRQLNVGESEVRDLEATPNFSMFLGEMSYSGYAVLGCSRILLVEGPSEVKAIQQLLRKYEKEHQVVLLPLGGASLIKKSSEAELAEIKRITPTVYALIDSERSSEGDALSDDRQGFIETCSKVRIQCHVLDRRALENYFCDRAVKQVKGDKYKALQPFQALKDANPGWSKAENWRIAREMELSELDGTDLGEFLSGL